MPLDVIVFELDGGPISTARGAYTRTTVQYKTGGLVRRHPARTMDRIGRAAKERITSRMHYSDYKVKGTGIKTKFEYVEAVFGEAAASRLKAAVENAIRWPVLAGAWYSFDSYNRLLETIAEFFYGGKLEALQDVGRYSADQVLRSTYQVFRTDEKLSHLRERLPNLYQRFYNCGTMALELAADRAFCRFVLSGAPVYVEPDLQVALGFSKQYWALHGFSAHVSNLRVEAERAAFDLVWHRTQAGMTVPHHAG